MAASNEEPRSGAQAVERALSLLRCFESSPSELRLVELAQRVGLSPSTTHRIARAMCAAGVLVQNPDTERYRLGPTLVVLGRKAEAGLGYDLALGPLQELVATTGESVNLGIRARSDVLVVLDVVAPTPLRFTQPAGSRVPIHTSAMGKCLLAFSLDPLREVAGLPDLPRLTDRTITERERLADELVTVRARGWALNDEERNQGVRALAAPIRRPDGTAIAAIAIQGPTSRLGDARLPELVEQLEEAAERLAPILVLTALR